MQLSVACSTAAACAVISLRYNLLWLFRPGYSLFHLLVKAFMRRLRQGQAVH